MILTTQPVLKTEVEVQPMVDLTEEYIKVDKEFPKDAGFLAAIYPVNQEQWMQFCADTGNMLPDDNGYGRGKLPISNITDLDIIEYINWLNRNIKISEVDPNHAHKDLTFYELNLKLNYPGDVYKVKNSEVYVTHKTSKGFRLPTKDQWDFLKGDAEEQEKKYGADKVLWGLKNSKKRPQVPGQLMPNKFGLFDMLGNLLEICIDYLDNKKQA